MLGTSGQNYYEILDIKPDASQAEIRNAYFRIKSAYSKDSAALYSILDEQETQVVLEQIEQAYLVLSNEEKRKEYDLHHGLLTTEQSIPISKKSEDNFFSFAQAAEQGHSAAHDAAANVLGEGSFFDDSPNTFRTSATKSTDTPIQSKSNSPFESQPTKEIQKTSNLQKDTFDYSTPRTLDDQRFQQDTFTATPPQNNEPKTYDNKLGIVRRIDIVKAPSTKLPELDTMIQAEVEFRGNFLKKVREFRGISLDQLSEFTKISRTYLNCLENEEFENLPAPVYVRGFITQIAKALKIPSDKAATGYMNYYKSLNNPVK